ncbi:MAG: alcohol dehydrogenase catalytic domain-containing protein [Streptosporangiales bacterium]|nr:alcohol dehydrogenase catalytic domain-containing protein [Streptosporangiales bacterium]
MTVRTAVLHGAKDLRLERRPAPRPAAGEALVAVEAVGLCGSDLHYYLDGRNGTNELRGPAVLGHEIGGTVTDGPADLLGTRVVVEPAVPCRVCASCVGGRYNLCQNGSCLGSPPTGSRPPARSAYPRRTPRTSVTCGRHSGWSARGPRRRCPACWRRPNPAAGWCWWAPSVRATSLRR